MSHGNFTFTDAQLNRQFPFHILVNPDFIIHSTGLSLSKITGNCEGLLFTDKFSIVGSDKEELSFNALKAGEQKLVIIKIINEHQNQLKGSFEYLEGTAQLLFTGSLWLNSLQELERSALTNKDFAHHDAVIDLLHLLQIRELINEDLNELLKKVNQQKKALNNAALQNQEFAVSLKESNQRFRYVSRATSDAIWDWDIVKDTIYRGEGFTKLFGHEGMEVSESLDFWKGKVHPDDLEETITAIENILESNAVNWAREYRFLNSSGNYAYVLDRGFVVRGENNEPLRMVGAVQDITDRKIAEIKMNEALVAVKKSNDDLEQFAYVTSHDLQEPLRMVASFLTLLEKKYGDSIDDNGKEYIRFAVDGAKRMQQLILDLLEYSRVGRTEDKLEQVDLNKLLSEIVMLHSKVIAEKQAKVYFTDMPVLRILKAPIRQVFQNLVSNSLKYTDDDKDPVITITAKDCLDHWEFSFKDNGIGIEPQHFERIFVIFQRLHNRQKYSGTGIGLAITKKIVENLGGSIWLESEFGKGTTFYLAIPKTIKTRGSIG